MKSGFVVTALSHQPDWAAFADQIGGGKPGLLSSLLESYRIAGGQLCVEEGSYIDRDFSAAYAAFYATLYKPYTKHCRRLHFFAASADLSVIEDGFGRLANWVRLHAPDYLGYVVLRPLEHAPVSHAVLSVERGIGDGTEVSVRSTYRAHLLGVELEVEGIPVTQQDMRTGSCAQAAIWTAGRHLHNRHSTPWFSMPDITDAALRPAESEAMQALPAGSEDLRGDSMVRALVAMGERPKVYAREGGDWVTPPERIVARYLESGIPVIVGLSGRGKVGHSVVAVGARYDWGRPNSASLPGLGSVADRITHFIVNDDQRGAYRRLPLEAEGGEEGCIPHEFARDAEFIIIPLPNKIFMAAEHAEFAAWDKIRTYSASRHELVRGCIGKKADAWDVDPAFYAAVRTDLVARTYLTYGWKYKQRMLRNTVSPALKRELLPLQLPRYVWITEFSLPGDLAVHDECTRRIRAHVVVDATGSQHWESVILTHLPGIVMVETFDISAPDAGYQTVLRVTERDEPYFPRVRGWYDYDRCGVAVAGPSGKVA